MKTGKQNKPLTLVKEPLMKITELRVGSYFTSDKLQQKTKDNVYQMYPNDFAVFEKQPGWFKPVVLNRELMVKIGAKEVSFQRLGDNSETDVLTLYYPEMGESSAIQWNHAKNVAQVCFAGNPVGIPIQFLHQLQDAILFLTGKFLTVNFEY